MRLRILPVAALALAGCGHTIAAARHAPPRRGTVTSPEPTFSKEDRWLNESLQGELAAAADRAGSWYGTPGVRVGDGNLLGAVIGAVDWLGQLLGLWDPPKRPPFSPEGFSAEGRRNADRHADELLDRNRR
jgi:hypothetical protein